VTSHEAGMAVPDWPNTFGYNMFFFPFSKWVGGIFYEHSHRILASAVGFLTIILAVWLGLKEERRWLRWLGFAALIGVILQGVLGGLRVVWMKDEIGVFHAALAQLYFSLVCAIALFSSRWWLEVGQPAKFSRGFQSVRKLALWTSVVIFAQLLLGATMRHQHAGLSIPDFPLAYGKVWPATDPASVAHYNQGRTEVLALNPITTFQVWLQMFHRIAALAICVMVGLTAWRGLRSLPPGLVRHLLVGWPLLIGTQVILGAATIWTNKSADVATAHVAVGALSLVTGVLLVLSCSRILSAGSIRVRTQTVSRDQPVPTFREVPA